MPCKHLIEGPVILGTSECQHLIAVPLVPPGTRAFQSDMTNELVGRFDATTAQRVVSQKWRSAEIDVTLELVLRVSQRKECPMTTFIAVRCPHCQKDQVVKRGTTARGTQRYLCQNTICAKSSFLLDYHNRGCLPEV